MMAEPHSDEVLQRVVITDVQIPFWELTGFLIKWSFAVVPAAFIWVVIGLFLKFLFEGT